MNTITLFVNYEREKKDYVLSALRHYNGVVTDISDVLNIIVFQTSPVYITDIKKTEGVTIVTNRVGGYIGL